MIEFSNVTKDFQNFSVLKNITFSVSKGEVVGIAGKSGAGKSTILKLVSGILQPTKGSVATKAFRLGYVFQKPRLLAWKTALDNAILPLRAMGVGRREAMASGKDLMDYLGLIGFDSTYPAQLSGGMCQRVAIARALLTKPDLLLMDEPFNGMDSILKDNIFQLLEKKIIQYDSTVLYVSHNTDELSKLSSRVIYLEKGSLL